MANLLSFNETCWYKGMTKACSQNCAECTRYLVIKTLMQESGVPDNLHHPIPLKPDTCDYSAFTRLADIKTDIDDFVAGGENLYICSKVIGNGKTSWALKLMYKYFSYMWTDGIETKALFINVPELLLQLKDFNSPLSKEYKSLITSVPLVVWDDIAITGFTNWDYMQLYVMLNQRCMKQLSNIYTSNRVNYKELADCTGERIASRILTGTTEIIELRGKDKR